MHPELETIMGEDNICKAFGTALQEVWSLIRKDLIDKLIESMPDQVKACKKASDWHTKYQILIIFITTSIYFRTLIKYHIFEILKLFIRGLF